MTEVRIEKDQWRNGLKVYFTGHLVGGMYGLHFPHPERRKIDEATDNNYIEPLKLNMVEARLLLNELLKIFNLGTDADVKEAYNVERKRVDKFIDMIVHSHAAPRLFIPEGTKDK